jgi:hypothetical protein
MSTAEADDVHRGERERVAVQRLFVVRRNEEVEDDGSARAEQRREHEHLEQARRGGEIRAEQHLHDLRRVDRAQDHGNPGADDQIARRALGGAHQARRLALKLPGHQRVHRDHQRLGHDAERLRHARGGGEQADLDRPAHRHQENLPDAQAERHRQRIEEQRQRAAHELAPHLDVEPEAPAHAVAQELRDEDEREEVRRRHREKDAVNARADRHHAMTANASSSARPRLMRKTERISSVERKYAR